ncbi:MAG TPA: hypothetical protein VIJ23_15875 [Mycobacterium sp.]
MSSNAAAANRAAAVAVNGGHNLVFTRPGTGAFAITNTVTAYWGIRSSPERGETTDLD